MGLNVPIQDEAYCFRPPEVYEMVVVGSAQKSLETKEEETTAPLSPLGTTPESYRPLSRPLLLKVPPLPRSTSGRH